MPSQLERPLRRDHETRSEERPRAPSGAERRELLSAATEALARSRDRGAMLAALARLAIPGLADGCIARALDAEGRTESIAIEHVDPILRDLALHRPDLAEVEWQRRGPLAIVPIVAGSRAIGAMSLSIAGGAHFDADALALADELAGRAAIALESARVFAEEHEARERAEHASRLKDELLATVSHELRTPLNAVLGWATVLREAVRDPVRLQRGLEVIERNARAQGRLVDDLLDVSRIVAGKLSVELRDGIELAPVLRAALEAVRPAAEAKSVCLRDALDGGLGAVRADPDRLQQIVVNLLANAIKFTPPAGHVSLTAVRAQGEVEIAVEDDGEGITEAFLPHLFERFRQADDTLARRHGGLGLGLAIVRHLVDVHGGTVRASSSGPGCGSRFVVTLSAR